jgi:hypothetical protein
MRRCLFLVMLLTTCFTAFAQLEPTFTSTISFGIQVPVYVWDGKTTAYDFAFSALNKNENQGVLVILGRDKKSIWCIEAGYSNDAAEESLFMNLTQTGVDGKRKEIAKEFTQADTSYRTWFDAGLKDFFKNKNLEKLTPVEAWSPPESYGFIAQVNSKELNRCFEWNFHVDSEDNGSCVFLFEWGAGVMPFQQTREVGFTNCTLTIPSDWTYSPGDKFHGYVAHAGDTLRYTRYAAIIYLPIEKRPYIYLNGPDSAKYIQLNAEIGAYNDTLRKEYPMMLTHDEKSVHSGDTTIRTLLPKPGITGRMLMEVHAYGDSFVLSTTELTPQEQSVFKGIMESWEYHYALDY